MIQIKSDVWKIFSETLEILQVVTLGWSVVMRLRSVVMIRFRIVVMARLRSVVMNVTYINW